MEIKDFEVNSENLAFSDDTIEQSYNEISKYRNESGRDLDLIRLLNSADQDLLIMLGGMLEVRANRELSDDAISTVAKELDEEVMELEYIDTVNENIHKNISDWDHKLKEIFNVAVLRKILEDIQYTNENITRPFLKDRYINKDMEDLTFIWLSSFRKKIKTKE